MDIETLKYKDYIIEIYPQPKTGEKQNPGSPAGIIFLNEKI